MLPFSSQCPLLAQSGHRLVRGTCPLPGKSIFAPHMSAYDLGAKPTSCGPGRRATIFRPLGGGRNETTGQLAVARWRRSPRVGVLVSASEPHPFAEALRRGFQRLGYAEGRNIILDVRYTQGRSDRAAELASELVRSDVAVIVAHFTPAVRAAMAATKTIPIVMVAGAH